MITRLLSRLLRTVPPVQKRDPGLDDAKTVLSTLPVSSVSILCAYAGIGSRSTPSSVLQLMSELAGGLARAGLTLRSGGAEGADFAFESGCDASRGTKEIFLPWSGFNGNLSQLCCPSDGAFQIAEEIHPRWKYCRQGARKLHARNVHQVLGIDLKSPVSFVLFWAPEKDGDVLGGTATAVNVAKGRNIPTFNLWCTETHELWRSVIHGWPPAFSNADASSD